MRNNNENLFRLIKSDFLREVEVNNWNYSIIKLMLSLFILKSFRMIVIFRIGHHFYNKNKFLWGFYKPIQYILNGLFLTNNGIELPYTLSVGSGFRIVHPIEIIFTPQSIIGKNCTIFNGVTFGVNHFDRSGYPVVGNNVIIYTGAKIIGKVKIGDNCVVGANSVVTKSIPANSVAGGIPAKVLKSRENLPDVKWKE